MPGRRHLKQVAALVAATLALAACDRTAETYRKYTDILQFEGKLRTELSPPDAQFSNDDLARNFEKIALNREYRREDEALIEETTPTRLSRWEKPVRYRIMGGAVTQADLTEYEAFATRLSGLTGLDIAEDDEDPNLTILILGPEERRAFIRQLQATGADQRMPLVVEWARDISYPCVGQVGYEDTETGLISGAMIVIKGELEGVLRQSCIHEELTQTLGLMNDDQGVRPSIFNDDQEFALLTAHDEYLLRILYDPRLRPGMEAVEAQPLVWRIIEELRPGGA